jgi:hypothetical protein
LDGLNNGITLKNGRVMQYSLTEFARDLGDDNVKAYSFWPRENWKRDGGYTVFGQRMKDAVVEKLPKIVETGRWQEEIYDATSDAHLLDNTSRAECCSSSTPDMCRGNAGKSQRDWPCYGWRIGKCIEILGQTHSRGDLLTSTHVLLTLCQV